MSKNCPHCKAEIDHLDFDVTGTCSAQLTQEEVKAGRPADYDLSCLTENVEFDNFRCPECSEIIGGYEDDAKEFLK